MEIKCNFCGNIIKKDKFGKIKGTYLHIKGNKYFIICNKCQSFLFSKYKEKKKVIEVIREMGNIKKEYAI